MKLKELLTQIKQIEKNINSSTIYICGGAARDRYMGKLQKISDLDLTTGDKTIDVVSQKLFELLQAKYKVTRKIMADGHSTIFFGNLKIDFSSNYNAPNIENILTSMGINPSNMKKETFSRDFTCNALLMDFNLTTLIDPTNKGFKDIKEKRIRTCLSPAITFIDKEKRVFRSVYLACKLGFEVDNSIIDFVKNHKNEMNIGIVNPIFIADKINQAFNYDPEKASKLLTQMDLWNFISINDTIYPYYLRHIKGTI